MKDSLIRFKRFIEIDKRPNYISFLKNLDKIETKINWRTNLTFLNKIMNQKSN